MQRLIFVNFRLSKLAKFRFCHLENVIFTLLPISETLRNIFLWQLELQTFQKCVFQDTLGFDPK